MRVPTWLAISKRDLQQTYNKLTQRVSAGFVQQLQLVLHPGLDPCPLSVTEIIGVVDPGQVAAGQEHALAVVGEVIPGNLQPGARR